MIQIWLIIGLYLGISIEQCWAMEPEKRTPTELLERIAALHATDIMTPNLPIQRLTHNINAHTINPESFSTASQTPRPPLIEIECGDQQIVKMEKKQWDLLYSHAKTLQNIMEESGHNNLTQEDLETYFSLKQLSYCSSKSIVGILQALEDPQSLHANELDELNEIFNSANYLDIQIFDGIKKITLPEHPESIKALASKLSYDVSLSDDTTKAIIFADYLYPANKKLREDFYAINHATFEKIEKELGVKKYTIPLAFNYQTFCMSNKHLFAFERERKKNQYLTITLLTDTGAPLQRIKFEGRDITRCACENLTMLSETHVAFLSSDESKGKGYLYVWNIANNKIVKRFSIENCNLWNRSLKKLTNKQVIISCDNSIEIWDVQKGRIKVLPVKCHNTNKICNLNDAQLAIQNSNNDIEIWNIHEEQCVKKLPIGKKIVKYRQLPDKKSMMIALENSLQIWDIEAEKCIQDIPLDQQLISFDLWKETNLILYFNEIAEIWDLTTKMHLKTIPHPLAFQLSDTQMIAREPINGQFQIIDITGESYPLDSEQVIEYQQIQKMRDNRLLITDWRNKSTIIYDTSVLDSLKNEATIEQLLLMKNLYDHTIQEGISVAHDIDWSSIFASLSEGFKSRFRHNKNWQKGGSLLKQLNRCGGRFNRKQGNL